MSYNATGNPASRRIAAMLDQGSFVEIGGAVTARNTDFNLQTKETPSDGVITGYGVIDGNLVYVYSQDATVLKGAIGEMHAKKIANIYDMAMKMGAPVIGLVDCAGLRLQEATDALEAFGSLYHKQAMASGVDTTDHSNLWNVWWRIGSCSRTYRFYIYGKQRRKAFCKFTKCFGRKRSF